MPTCRNAKTPWQALGKVNYVLKPSEQGNTQSQRSLVFIKDVKIGDTIDETHIGIARPSYELAFNYHVEMMGKRDNYTISFGTAVT